MEAVEAYVAQLLPYRVPWAHTFAHACICAMQKTRIQVWLYEQVGTRLEGKIIVRVKVALHLCRRYLLAAA